MHGQKSLDTALNVISNRPIHMKIAKMVFAKTRKRLLGMYVHYLSFISLLLRSFFEYVTNAWKLLVIHQSTNKCKVKLQNKEKIICFIGRLNSSKGYDLFGKAVIKILDKYLNWKAIVIGDEPREELDFNHKIALFS